MSTCNCENDRDGQDLGDKAWKLAISRAQYSQPLTKSTNKMWNKNAETKQKPETIYRAKELAAVQFNQARKDQRQRVCCLLVGCLTSSNRLVYLRDGSAQTILRAATLR